MSKLLDLTTANILARAEVCLDICKNIGVKYHLEYPNGGRNPDATHPFDILMLSGYKYYVSDCIGTALWIQGISRKFDGTATVPAFPDTPNITGGYMNCTSIVQEAMGFERRKGQSPYVGGRFFKILDKPEPGCLILFSGRTKTFPTNPRHGHIAVIVSAPENPVYPDKEGIAKWISRDTRNHRAPLQVVQCGSFGKYDNKAVRKTDASTWLRHQSMFVKLNREFLLHGDTV